MNARIRRFAAAIWHDLRHKVTVMQVAALTRAAGIGAMLQRGQWPWVFLCLPALALVLFADDREEDR